MLTRDAHLHHTYMYMDIRRAVHVSSLCVNKSAFLWKNISMYKITTHTQVFKTTPKYTASNFDPGCGYYNRPLLQLYALGIITAFTRTLGPGLSIPPRTLRSLPRQKNYTFTKTESFPPNTKICVKIAKNYPPPKGKVEKLFLNFNRCRHP